MTSHFFFYYLEKYFWLGMIAVVNGDWRWIYDQTKPNYKFWVEGHPYSSKNYDCLIMVNYSGGKLYDFPCTGIYPYICENNFCKFIILFRR
jgi:hypothetical protein